jgi:hypothetical protein
MPFFFGFNFNETCSVLPSCIDENHPVQYEPISCGEVMNVLPLNIINLFLTYMLIPYCQNLFKLVYNMSKAEKEK